MFISVIIPYYKKLDYLDLVLQGFTKQSYTSFEIIIAEDNNEERTKQFIDTVQQKGKLKISLIQQEDNGFQKNKIVNQAILQSKGSFLIFIDGDCIPHKDFVRQYSLLAQEGTLLYGRRVMLSKSRTQKLLSQQSIQSLSFISILCSTSKRIEDGLYLPYQWTIKKKQKGMLGSNWGAFKKDIEQVNGFDEDYTTAGVGEDVDIEWRLLRAGNTVLFAKHHLVQYHLDHPLNYDSSSTAIGYALLKKKQEEGLIYCKNGLIKCNR